MLSNTIRRKQGTLQVQLQEIGDEALQERLEGAAQRPASPPYRLSTLIQEIKLTAGRPVLLVEVPRSSPSQSSTDLGAEAARLVSWGADALAVDTPSGYADLVAVCRATDAPVLARDWQLHPLQPRVPRQGSVRRASNAVEAKEAGAAGILGIVASVSGRGAPVCSSYAAALGLDAPVEVVNLQEARAMEAATVNFFAVNVAVGIALARVPGFSAKVAAGILGDLPFGASSLVGVRSEAEAAQARDAGAARSSTLCTERCNNMPRKLSSACQLHDRVNLVALPILGGLALLGLFDLYPAAKVTNMFLMYIVADAVWIWMEPDALPSLQPVILGHHVVTFMLLLFPLRHPAFANFTCWDGITELNTFFLIARRQWHSQRNLMHWLYWATFVPMRLVLYPALLVKFWLVLHGFPLWDRLLVVACQFLLCCFNIGMVYASLARRRVVRKAPQLAAEAAAAKAAHPCTHLRAPEGALKRERGSRLAEAVEAREGRPLRQRSPVAIAVTPRSPSLDCSAARRAASLGNADTLQIIFRPLCPSDYTELRTAHERLFPIDYEDAFYWSAVRGDGVQSDAAIHRQENGEEELAGFITVRIVALRGCDTQDRALLGLESHLLDSQRVAYILTLGVLEPFRRAGVAGALLAHTVAACAGATPACRAVFLHVATYNTAACAFYRRRGFQEVARLPAFYHIASGRQPDAERTSYDAHLYALDLGAAEALSPAMLLDAALAPLRMLADHAAACMPHSAHRKGAKRKFVDYLNHALLDEGISVFLDEDSLKPGDPAWKTIEAALAAATVVDLAEVPKTDGVREFVAAQLVPCLARCMGGCGGAALPLR
ncbi:hypothetical protein WJX81_000287 [Elliptochloris bilobata]|uniref:N-alpha-acetyltransferase 60 n=1 Tax=Elliptochloris bilobata TaxID=381761 RepID=A0AAW1QX78_9CHLO